LRATIFLIFNFFLSDAMQDQWWGDMQNIDYQEQNEIQKNKKQKSQDHWKWKNKDKNGKNKMETNNFT
jgi:hypothetical protein